MTSKMDAYRVFSEVAKYQSFSRAAKALYMTQPAVSQAIMNLEKDLNIRLFTRTSKGVTLTTDGELLFEYVNSANFRIPGSDVRGIEDWCGRYHLKVLSASVSGTVQQQFAEYQAEDHQQDDPGAGQDDKIR